MVWVFIVASDQLQLPSPLNLNQDCLIMLPEETWESLLNTISQTVKPDLTANPSIRVACHMWIIDPSRKWGLLKGDKKNNTDKERELKRILGAEGLDVKVVGFRHESSSYAASKIYKVLKLVSDDPSKRQELINNSDASAKFVQDLLQAFSGGSDGEVFSRRRVDPKADLGHDYATPIGMVRSALVELVKLSNFPSPDFQKISEEIQAIRNRRVEERLSTFFADLKTLAVTAADLGLRDETCSFERIESQIGQIQQCLSLISLEKGVEQLNEVSQAARKCWAILGDLLTVFTTVKETGMRGKGAKDGTGGSENSLRR